MKKVLCLLLTLFCLLGCCSCGSKKGKSDESSSVSTGENTQPELVANVPDVDMGEKDFVVVTDNWWGNSLAINSDFSATEENGNIVGDAQFRARRNIEDRFHCFVKEKNFSGPTESVTGIRTEFESGTQEYDVYLARIMYWQTLAQEGLLYDLKSDKIPYLDFSKIWWDSNSVEELSIQNKLYCVAGDISLQDEYWTSCIAFNKSIISEYQMDDPYALVKSNNWTFETFLGISKKFSEDVNSDGVWDVNDHYGFLYQRDTLSAMIMASGENYAKKNAEDIPYITIGESRSVDVIDAAMNVLYDSSSLQVMNLSDYIVTRDSMFQNDRALFCYFYMTSLETLRKMESDFGILPVPKYKADQTEWYSEVSSWSAGVVCLPGTNSGENLEQTCIVLEALACENRKLVMPAYYDKLLSGIVAKDADSVRMLDLIFENRRYDIGGCCNFGSLTELIYLTMNNNRDVSSFLGGRTIIARKDIEAMVRNLNKQETAQ